MMPMPMIKNLNFQVMRENYPVATISIQNGRLAKVEKYTNEYYNQPFKYEPVTLEFVLDFLQSRAIQPDKQNIVQILERLGLDHYNTLEILRKTHGVDFDDFYWIKFEGENISYDDVRVR